MEDYLRNLAEFEARFSTGSLPGISGAAAVAGWFSLPALRRTEDLASARGAAAMCGLRVSEFSDGRDHPPGPGNRSRLGFVRCGQSPARRTAPALSGCNESWAWAVTTRRGLGCIILIE